MGERTKSYHVEVSKSIYTVASDPEAAIEKAKRVILSDGLEISVELEDEEGPPEGKFNEGRDWFSWDLLGWLSRGLNSKN